MTSKPVDSGDPLALDVPAMGKRRRFYLIGAALAFLAVLLSAAIGVDMAIGERAKNLNQSVQSRLEAIANGKIEVLDTWFEGTATIGDRLVRSDLVRLYVYEKGIAAGRPTLAAALAEQQPYMQQVIDDLAKDERVVAAGVIGGDGQLLLASSGFDSSAVAGLHESGNDDRSSSNSSTELNSSEREKTVTGPLRFHGQDLVLDFALAISAPQTLDSGDRRHSGVLIMTLRIEPVLQELLARDGLSKAGERQWVLVEARQAQLEGVLNGFGTRPSQWAIHSFADGIEVTPVDNPVKSRSNAPQHSFDRLPTMIAMQPAVNLPWFIISEIDEQIAMAPLTVFRNSAIVTTGAFLALLVVILVAFGWRQASHYNASMASQYKDLAGRINNSKQLIERVTSSVPDMIWLKRMDGTIAWGNGVIKRFAGALDGPASDQKEQDVFGSAAAPLMEEIDRMALADGNARLEEHAIMLKGEQRFVDLAKMPIRDADGMAIGLVGVIRDVTEIVAQRRRRERLVRQTVDSLIRAVELSDPYLLGHTERMRSIAMEMAIVLGCSDDQKATIELAAGLSQIGKIFVPKDLLTKPGRHTEEEIAIMQTHIDHALRVVEDVDFELPVAEVLSQMHERLDGSGYPNGLDGESILPPARILAVADVFCARTAPRSYRELVAPQEVIGHLRANADRYDKRVVDVLASLCDEKPDLVGADDGGEPVPA